MNPGVGVHQYDNGETAAINAEPAVGWQFDGWSGDLGGVNNPTGILMDSDKSVTAHFVESEVILTVGVTGQGTVNPPVGNHTYNRDTEVTLIPTANAGWAFDGWTGAVASSDPIITITMDDHKSMTANFVQMQTRNLTIAKTGNGAVSPGVGTHPYNHGAQLQLTATADPGWAFWGWTGDVSGSNPQVTITMNGDKSVTAVFKQLFTLTTNVSGSGSVSQSPDLFQYMAGEQVTLSATAGQGHIFAHWSGSVTGTSNPIVITMDENKSVTANFELLCFTLSLNVNPGDGGTISANPAPNCSGGLYYYNTDVTLTANPGTDYEFANWSGALSGSSNPDTLTIQSNSTATAIFNSTSSAILFVVGNTNLNDGDQAVYDRLDGDGYDVVVKDDSASQTSDANGKDLVIISSTCSSGNVNTKFKNVAVPVMVWEPWIYDDMKMADDFGWDNDNERKIKIIDSNHPLANGNGTGDKTVTNGTHEFGWGRPTSSAAKVVSTKDNNTKYTIFAYEAGASMVDGFNAPARRVGFFLTNDAADDLKNAGWGLFDAAVDWAMNGG